MKVLVIANQRVDELRKPLSEAGCDVSKLSPDTDLGFLTRYVHYLYSLYTELRTGEYDLIITFGPGFIATASIFFGGIYDVSVVPRVAGDKFVAYKNQLLRDISNRDVCGLFHTIIRLTMFIFCMITATSVIVVSGHLQSRYEVFSEWAHQTFIIVPVSIDKPPNDAKEHINNNDGQTLLTVTNLNFKGKYQGVKKSLTAVFEILDERDDLEYVIAGDGKYHEELRAYIDASSPNEDVGRRIHVQGYVDPIAPLYRQADIFVYFSDQDGYPNVILEAMSYRLPVVTNDAVGMSEQIVDGETGIFVNPDDPGDIQTQISSLLDNPEKRERFGSKARTHVQRANSHEAVGQQYYQALQLIVGEEI